MHEAKAVMSAMPPGSEILTHMADFSPSSALVFMGGWFQHAKRSSSLYEMLQCLPGACVNPPVGFE